MVTYRCHSLPLTSAGAGTAKQREKRSTEINVDAPWASDDDSEVCQLYSTSVKGETYGCQSQACRRPSVFISRYIHVILAFLA